MYMELIGAVRPTIEILYFVSGVVVAVVAIIALKQIGVMKKAIKVQSQRDALQIASEQCRYYMEDIIEMQNELSNCIAEHNVEFFNGWSVEVEGDKIKVRHDGDVNMNGLDKINFPKPFNAMEAFATYFTSQVGDEVVAFNALGTTYVTTTENFLPMLLRLNDDGYYNNVVRLYVLWKNRILKTKLQRESDAINKKIENCSICTVTPIGAD